jgi:tetraacyldisaccharide 4'-kinase
VVARAVPPAPLLFAGSKNSCLEAALELFKPSHIVLDDAFQSWGVYRDLDIVLLDAGEPIGNGRVLPAGSLREVPAALKRADWIGFNNIRDQLPSAISAASGLNAITLDKLVFGIRRKLYVEDTDGRRCDPDPRPSASLSSIARPDAFDTVLEEKGWNIELSIRYPDHHFYSPDDINWIRQCLADHHLSRLITTEKDWVKLEPLKMDIESVLLAGLELELAGADPLDTIKKPQAKPAASS